MSNEIEDVAVDSRANENQNAVPCTCPSGNGSLHWPCPLHPPEDAAPVDAKPPHPDNEAVDRFAAAMKAKMAASRAKGRGGWNDENQCSENTLAQMLVEHVAKGDPVDIANFAMMLHQREAVAVEHHPCNGGQAKRAIAAAAQPSTAQDDAAQAEPVAIFEGWEDDGARLSPLITVKGELRAGDALYARPPVAQGDALSQDVVGVRSDLVPGKMRCAKCSFSLLRTTLNVATGSAYAGNNETEPCPNGCGPLWPMTWEQEAREGYKLCDQLFERAQAAEAALASTETLLKAATNEMEAMERERNEARAALAQRTASQPDSGRDTAPVLWAALSLGGKVVYSHESRENVEMNAQYIKTPTQIVGLAAMAAPRGVKGGA